MDGSDGSFRVYVGDDRKNLNCRFYENKFPEIESVVMVNVQNIADMGAYVSLLEYNNIEGMILLSELSRRRFRSIHNLNRVNRNEVVMVLRVDEDKGYIDLSKRRVSPEDVAACEDRFNKAKAVHGVLRHLAERRKLYLQDLYETIGWPLYKKYGHAFDAFKLAISDDSVDIFQDIGIPQDFRDELKSYVLQRLDPQQVKIRSDMEVLSALMAPFVKEYTDDTTSEKAKIDILWKVLRCAHEAIPSQVGTQGVTGMVNVIAAEFDKAKASVLITALGEKDVIQGNQGGIYAYQQRLTAFMAGYGKSNVDSFLRDIVVTLRKEGFRFLEKAEVGGFQEMDMNSSCQKVQRSMYHLRSRASRSRPLH